MSDYFPTVRFRLDLQHTYNITYMYIYYTLYVYNLKIIRYIYIQYTHTHTYILYVYIAFYIAVYSPSPTLPADIAVFTLGPFEVKRDGTGASMDYVLGGFETTKLGLNT